MPSTSMIALTDEVRAAARPLAGAAQDYDPLIEMIGDARFVLLGEASHGTHEFYRERSRYLQTIFGITPAPAHRKGFRRKRTRHPAPD